MTGPFKIIFKDFFGQQHEVTVWANNSDEAIENFEKYHWDYYYELIKVYIDYEQMLNLARSHFQHVLLWR